MVTCQQRGQARGRVVTAHGTNVSLRLTVFLVRVSAASPLATVSHSVIILSFLLKVHFAFYLDRSAFYPISLLHMFPTVHCVFFYYPV
jgi:hypothetical protein